MRYYRFGAQPYAYDWRGYPYPTVRAIELSGYEVVGATGAPDHRALLIGSAVAAAVGLAVILGAKRSNPRRRPRRRAPLASYIPRAVARRRRRRSRR